jgi:hypothetical protein
MSVFSMSYYRSNTSSEDGYPGKSRCESTHEMVERRAGRQILTLTLYKDPRPEPMSSAFNSAALSTAL